jgi:hypothetical protein
MRYVIVGLVSCAFTWSSADADEHPPRKYRMIHKIFVGSRLIPCEEAVGISAQDCKSTQDYLGYATWQLAAAASWSYSTIPRNWVEATEIDDLMRHRAPELALENVGVADIYVIEGKRLADCLRRECAEVISMIDHTPEIWATIIDLSIPYLVCLDGHYAREELKQIWLNGGWNRYSQHTDYRFEVAAADELRSCPRNGLPEETFSLGYVISNPFGRF